MQKMAGVLSHSMQTLTLSSGNSNGMNLNVNTVNTLTQVQGNHYNEPILHVGNLNSIENNTNSNTNTNSNFNPNLSNVNNVNQDGGSFHSSLNSNNYNWSMGHENNTNLN